MKNRKNKEDLTTQVMKTIREDRVKMKSRIHFLLGSVLAGIGVAGVVVGSGFTTHLMRYQLRSGEAFEYLRLGMQGVRPFVALFPFLYMVIFVTILVLGLRILKRYEWSYKRGTVAMLVALIGFSSVLGIVFDKSNVEGRLNKPGAVGRLYQGKMRIQGGVAGVVTKIEGSMVLLETKVGNIVVVETDEGTRVLGREKVEVGTVLHVVGEWDGEIFNAKAIFVGLDVRRGGEVRGVMNRGPDHR